MQHRTNSSVSYHEQYREWDVDLFLIITRARDFSTSDPTLTVVLCSYIYMALINPPISI